MAQRKQAGSTTGTRSVLQPNSMPTVPDRWQKVPLAKYDEYLQALASFIFFIIFKLYNFEKSTILNTYNKHYYYIT